MGYRRVGSWLEVSFRKELTDEISLLSKAATAINVVALTTKWVGASTEIVAT